MLAFFVQASAVVALAATTTRGPAPLAHRIYGTVVALAGTALVLRTRSGRSVSVDARATHTYVLLRLGRPIIVNGPSATRGVVHPRTIWHTYPDAAHWPPDR